MTGFLFLDVAIGVLFLVLTYALVASALVEALASFFAWRSADLKRGVESLIGDDFEAFWQQPLIESQKTSSPDGWPLKGIDSLLGRLGLRTHGAKRDPSYLAPDLVAKELLDWLGVAGDSPADIVRKLKEAAEAETPPTPTGADTLSDAILLLQRQKGNAARSLVRVLASVKGEASEAEQAVSAWFDATITRVSGVYARRTRLFLFWTGFLLALVTQVDFVGYTHRLATDDAFRAQQVALATEASEAESAAALAGQLNLTIEVGSAADLDALTALADEIREIDASLRDATGTGQSAETPETDAASGGVWSFVSMLLSALLMGFAVTLGAQFWFDLLKSFVRVRSAGTRVAGALTGSSGSSGGGAPATS